MKIFKKKVFWIPVIILLAFFLLSCGYTVKKNENAIVVHLGKIKTVVTSPGFHVHLPFVESVTKVYTGDILYDIPTSDVITSDKKSMIADDYVVWKVTNPSKYYQSLGAVRGRAEERIEAAVYNATKLTISSMKQDEIIAARGSTLTDMITKKSNSEMAQYGIEIEIAEIKALDLPDDNKNAVYGRMISDRNNIAASYTAKGNADAQKIKNETDKDVSIIKSEANAEALKIEAEGEAEYMRILADAYDDEGKAEFYNYLRGLDAMKSLAGENKTIILDKNSELVQILYGDN